MCEFTLLHASTSQFSVVTVLCLCGSSEFHVFMLHHTTSEARKNVKLGKSVSFVPFSGFSAASPRPTSPRLAHLVASSLLVS
jgi:hypothetical protein